MTRRAGHPTAAARLLSTVRVTDADLVAQARAGDQAAFGELVDRHRTAVYRAVRAALGGVPEADEAAQDAFVLAWRRLDGFRGQAAFRTWLLAIAWRQAINHRRGLRRWWNHFDAAAPVDDDRLAVAGWPRPAAATPEQAAAQRELGRDVASAIRALTPRLRGTFLLVQSGEYSYEEISAMVDAPVGTVKWRVAEARRLVKRRLKALGHGELG